MTKLSYLDLLVIESALMDNISAGRAVAVNSNVLAVVREMINEAGMLPPANPSPTYLTNDQARALYHFAWENGRTWKSKLLMAWENACQDLPYNFQYKGTGPVFEYRCYLQQIRNSLGPSWLKNYKLIEPKIGKAFKEDE